MFGMAPRPPPGKVCTPLVDLSPSRHARSPWPCSSGANGEPVITSRKITPLAKRPACSTSGNCHSYDRFRRTAVPARSHCAGPMAGVTIPLRARERKQAQAAAPSDREAASYLTPGRAHRLLASDVADGVTLRRLGGRAGIVVDSSGTTWSGRFFVLFKSALLKRPQASTCEDRYPSRSD
jgi:hypothetical protein